MQCWDAAIQGCSLKSRVKRLLQAKIVKMSSALTALHFGETDPGNQQSAEIAFSKDAAQEFGLWVTDK